MNAHKTKYKVVRIRTGTFELFDNLEDAKTRAFEIGDHTPVKLLYPLYQ